jgi:dTDP-4-amino-4,6-dideoxygalactose transaminase
MILFRDRAATVLYEVLTTLAKNTKFLLPLNICPIVPDTFLKANIKFEFIDIDLNTLCMDEVLALEAIKNDSSISGILFVKTFGIEIESEVFYQKIKDLNREIFIIDDQCLSIQNFDFDIDNSFASLTLFSSGYSKYVDIGYGGFGFLKDKEFKSFFNDDSTNENFLDYQINIKEKISLMREHKVKINTIYKKGIPSNLHLGSAFENWRFSILIDNKDKLLEEIFQTDGLFASSHYGPIDYKYVDNPAQDSNAQKIVSRIVNLFNDFRFTEEKAKSVVKVINDFINYEESKKF